MPPSLEPCPCPKCNGALVSHKTVLRHAAANLTKFTNQPIGPIPTFDEWIAAAPELLDRVSDGSSEDDYDGNHGMDGMDGIEDEQVIRERRLDWTDEPLDVCRDCRIQCMLKDLLSNLKYL